MCECHTRNFFLFICMFICTVLDQSISSVLSWTPKVKHYWCWLIIWRVMLLDLSTKGRRVCRRDVFINLCHPEVFNFAHKFSSYQNARIISLWTIRIIKTRLRTIFGLFPWPSLILFWNSSFNVKTHSTELNQTLNIFRSGNNYGFLVIGISSFS